MEDAASSEPVLSAFEEHVPAGAGREWRQSRVPGGDVGPDVGPIAAQKTTTIFPTLRPLRIATSRFPAASNGIVSRAGTVRLPASSILQQARPGQREQFELRRPLRHGVPHPGRTDESSGLGKKRPGIPAA